MNETTHTHGASCTCVTCMERSDRAFTVWYDDEPAPATATTTQEPPVWQHKPPTCGRCLARMRYPRPAQGDGWTWGAFGWRHDCGWHR